jgi:hypothetical protein
MQRSIDALQRLEFVADRVHLIRMAQI